MEYRLYKSNNPLKKFMVKFTNETTGHINVIHFGSRGKNDFTITGDKERKKLYKLRHASDNINDLSYSGCWAMNLLWNKRTIESSIVDMEKIFNIKITNNLIYYHF